MNEWKGENEVLEADYEEDQREYEAMERETA